MVEKSDRMTRKPHHFNSFKHFKNTCKRSPHTDEYATEAIFMAYPSFPLLSHLGQTPNEILLSYRPEGPPPAVKWETTLYYLKEGRETGKIKKSSQLL